MAYNVFVNFGDNIKGECTDKDHKDWCMALSFQQGVTQPASMTQKTAGGRSAEDVTLSEFSITKLVDAATPKLIEAACKGTHVPTVTIELYRSGGDPVKYMSYVLSEVLFSGVYHNGDPTGTAQFPTETVNMTFGAIKWQYTKQDGTGAAKGQVAAQWSVTQGTAA